MSSDQDTPASMPEQRITELERWQEAVRTRFEALEDTIQDHEDKIDTLEDEKEQLRTQITELKNELAVLDGLAEQEQTTPQKRAVDLRRALIRRAKNRDADGYATHYKDVGNILSDLGHEAPHPPQWYKAIEDAATMQGFREKKVAKDGGTAQGIEVRLSKLPFDPSVNRINNEMLSNPEPTDHDSAETSHE